MLFNSLQFFVFFPIAVGLYFATPRSHRWVTALLASYYFYMCWKPAFIILIIASTLVDYGVGIGLDRAKSQGRRTLLLLVSLTVNLGLLFTFKYLDFACQAVEGLLGVLGLQIELAHPELLLPVGISFYTFQTLSYTIDVYRRQTPTEYHLGRFATYVAFFPQLVAGPIERSGQLLPQFRKVGEFSLQRLSGGLRLILWGLFKKMCIADLVATPVNIIFAAPERFDGSYLVLGLLFFAVQIYCDFSGYSDIAIGSARIMGIDLMMNFRRPYFARSIGEFWKRWHISLSTWFRDYVYVSIGGNRVSTGRWVFNILLVFLVSGIWHGAAWTFIVWGLLHGTYLLLERALGPAAEFVSRRTRLSSLPRLEQAFQVALTFVLVNIGWVFFRAPNVEFAFDYLARMMIWTSPGFAELNTIGLNTFEVMLCFAMPCILLVVDGCMEWRPRIVGRLWESGWFRSVIYVAGIYGIIMFGIFDEVDFIYFQF